MFGFCSAQFRMMSWNPKSARTHQGAYNHLPPSVPSYINRPRTIQMLNHRQIPTQQLGQRTSVKQKPVDYRLCMMLKLTFLAALKTDLKNESMWEIFTLYLAFDLPHPCPKAHSWATAWCLPSRTSEMANFSSPSLRNFTWPKLPAFGALRKSLQYYWPIQCWSSSHPHPLYCPARQMVSLSLCLWTLPLYLNHSTVTNMQH